MVVLEATFQELSVIFPNEESGPPGLAESAFPFAPIYKLPLEILSKIFVELVDPYTQIQDIFQILEVCKHWRRAALETPELFIYIYHDYNAPPWPPTRDLNPNFIIPRFLRLSAKLPINIKINFDSHCEWRFVSQYEGAWMSTACLEALRLHLPRYRSLHFLSMEQKELENFIPNGTELYLPLLHDLVIEFWSGYRYGPDNHYIPPPNLGKWIVPNLQNLKIGRYGDHNQEIMKMSPLDFIEMVPEHISRLEISYIAWNIRDYMNILRMFPNLKSCIMHTDYSISMGTHSWQLISLLNLTELQIVHRDSHRHRGVENFSMNPLLEALHVPRLESFSLFGQNAFEETVTYTTGFSSVFSAKGVLPLKQLTIKNIHISGNVFFSVLSRAVLLEFLSLGGLHSELEKAILYGLTPKPTETWKWPHLRYIQLQYCTGEKVVQMLKAHISSYECDASGTGLDALEIKVPAWGTDIRELKQLKNSQTRIKVLILSWFEEEGD